MEPENPKAKGGVARAKSLTPQSRTEIAKKAAAARWDAPPTKTVISGSADKTLTLGNVEIECYVLDDGTRVITQASVLMALGRSKKLPGRSPDADPEFPPILQGKALRPFITDAALEEAQPIPFKLPSGGRALGYRAQVLPTLCEIYLSARAANALPSNQLPAAAAAEIIVRGLAHVGIIALVDEATGYQDIRAKDALAKILEAYVAEELQAWVRTFPVGYYKELCRLRGINFDPSAVSRPSYFGHLTNNIVYKRLAPGLLTEIKDRRAKDSKKKNAKFHQQLTPDAGHPKLREHLASTVTVMKLSNTYPEFIALMDKVHPIYRDHSQGVLWDDDSGIGI